jgi:hypothetical protein
MLQLTENKEGQHAQIAKKSRNAVFASASLLEDGFQHFSPFLLPLRGHQDHPTVAVSTRRAPRIGVLRPSMLPCCQRYQPAISGVSGTRAAKR